MHLHGYAFVTSRVLDRSVSTARENWFWPTFRDGTGPGSMLEAVIIAGHVNTRISMISYRTWQA